MRSGSPAGSFQHFGQRVLGTKFDPLPSRPPLQFDLAGSGTARTNDELPRMAHQIGVVELHSRAILSIVVQRV
jgi:hypothetical protein